ncbi:hypothetical protein [Arthrobacter sp. HLT1-21]
MNSTGTRRLVAGSIALVATIFILPSALFEVFVGTTEGAVVALFALGLALLVGGICLVLSGSLSRSRELHSPRTYDSLSYDAPSHTTRQGGVKAGARGGTGVIHTPQISSGSCAGDLGSL